MSIDSRAVVSPRAEVASDAEIGPFAVIGAEVTIGPGCWIGPHVVINGPTVLGEGNRVYQFASLGEAPQDMKYRGEPTRLVIGKRNTFREYVTINRGTVGGIGETRIGTGTKIDNLVQIAHGVHVGRHTLIVSQAGVAGSTTIGDHVVLAGQVGVAGHLTIGDRVRATAQTGIPSSVGPGAFISGYPAIDNREWLKASAVFRHLPDLKKRLRALGERITALEARLSGREPRED